MSPYADHRSLRHAGIDILIAGLLALLGLALAACPKPPPPAVPTDDVEAPPKVGIASIDPAHTMAGTAVTVRIKGHGYVEGTEVYLGSRRAAGVDVIDDRELTFRASEDLRADVYDVRVVTPEGDQAVKVRGFEVRAVQAATGDCTLRTVYFDFNEATLGSETRQVLSDNARCIESSAMKQVRLEGHADERGSTDYNLSLGQRRAESVKDYMMNLGIPESSLSTVSYGEERPADRGTGESSWTKNRRVEFVAR